MAERSNTPLAEETAAQAAERIYHEWDAALGAKDLDAAMALYAPDCVLESPLVRHLLGMELGIVEGREKLREFVRIVFERQPATRQRYREGFFTDGQKLMWEYPRSKPGGEQMDFVEVMEIEDGLIRRHCVYWGWYGVRLLEHDAITHSERLSDFRSGIGGNGVIGEHLPQRTHHSLWNEHALIGDSKTGLFEGDNPPH